MVFKRRDRRPWWRIMAEALWPRGGWRRAFLYVQHRLNRLPGSPERIGRGIWAGVFVTFTPYYGLHFLMSAALAWAMRGNVIAALLATFFGNPLTYVPIAAISLKTGHLLLGTEFEEGAGSSLWDKFASAGSDLNRNLWALVTGEPQDWSDLLLFWDEVLWPYTVGGIIPGLVAATIIYVISVPVIRAYQKRRAAKIRRKIDEKLHKMRAQRTPGADAGQRTE
ncbi:DUF2062 domain-containing protein [Rhodosalinus halophilus]|uniref:DUF2062 domain-containing protein n=1 Tax=Rhodosalinus halophilus TaxID=2259333 RepID=A0A365U9Q3_9RHOB|nr:DUF2062 domain-containing protein [Rhodosalinus halophilus]RBI85750.1 DUF2062 domain-containing protein [Rhodosalinus halophilus]